MPEEVFGLVKENVIRLFEKELDAQVILHAKHQVRKRLELTVDRKISTMEQLADHVERIRQQIRRRASGNVRNFVKRHLPNDVRIYPLLHRLWPQLPCQVHRLPPQLLF